MGIIHSRTNIKTIVPNGNMRGSNCYHLSCRNGTRKTMGEMISMYP